MPRTPNCQIGDARNRHAVASPSCSSRRSEPAMRRLGHARTVQQIGAGIDRVRRSAHTNPRIQPRRIKSGAGVPEGVSAWRAVRSAEATRGVDRPHLARPPPGGVDEPVLSGKERRSSAPPRRRAGAGAPERASARRAVRSAEATRGVDRPHLARPPPGGADEPVLSRKERRSSAPPRAQGAPERVSARSRTSAEATRGVDRPHLACAPRRTGVPERVSARRAVRSAEATRGVDRPHLARPPPGGADEPVLSRKERRPSAPPRRRAATPPRRAGAPERVSARRAVRSATNQ